MNEINRQIASIGLQNMQFTLEKLYNNGVVEGVKIVENLIEQHNITNMDTLKEALKLFVVQYEEADNAEAITAPIDEAVTETAEVEPEGTKEEEPVEPDSVDDHVEETGNE